MMSEIGDFISVLTENNIVLHGEIVTIGALSPIFSSEIYPNRLYGVKIDSNLQYYYEVEIVKNKTREIRLNKILDKMRSI